MFKLVADMTVVEGGSFIAAPSIGLHLAQMGAVVIRFDQIGGGPDSNRWPLGANGSSLYWEGLNKGKRSIAIDLARPPGRELAQRIAAAGDGLFVTNLPEKGFLSFERLSALRSDLICLRIMGWPDGATAVDYTVNASIGLPMMTGFADDPRPINHVLPAWDLLAGAYGAFALLAAERYRHATGRGQELRLALSDVAAATISQLGNLAEVLQHGNRPRSGNDLFGAFGRDFETADGKRLMIVAITSRQWNGLVNALEMAEEIGSLEQRLGICFSVDEGARFVHRAALFPIVAQKIAAQDAAGLAARFDENGVCWSRYRSLKDAFDEEPRFFKDNPVFGQVAHPSGTYPTSGAPVRMSTGERQPPLPAPRIGEHTDEILTSLLGMASGEIAALHDTGIVA